MVQKIDKELLKKRAEHNDGELSTLKEITLHQFDLEKIENLDVYCRQLEIILLQNNQIGKIENLHKLKSLKYLNLALNNIKKVENLEKCESLQKLDLTVNFVDDLLSVEDLRHNEFLRELFLVGNPCTQVDGYRAFVITVLPQLSKLDGVDIERSERLSAAHIYPEIRARLEAEKQESAENKVELTQAELPKEGLLDQISDIKDKEELEKILEDKRNKFKDEVTGHTPEDRLRIARELDVLRNGVKEEPKVKTIEQVKRPLLNKEGRILQRNEGKWKFKFQQDSQETVTLVVEVSKYLDTSFIDVDVHETYITVTIKGKVLQLTLDEAVMTDQVVCERSRMSGDLVVTMLKQNSKENKIKEIHSLTKRRNADEHKKMFDQAIQKPIHNQQRNKRYERLFEPTEAVDIRNIVQEKTCTNTKQTSLMMGSKIKDIKFAKSDIKAAQTDDFVDDPEVPPLC